MSLAPEVTNPAIDNLVQSSLESEYESLRLKWIPYEEIAHIEPTQVDNVYNATCKYTLDDDEVVESMIMLLCLGNSGECTQTLVSEFARIYSLPTHKYNNTVSQYRRYSRWLNARNELIKGFTEYDNNYYMVADGRFYRCYSRYGFCAACEILRCSPVWCICGHKELSDDGRATTSNSTTLSRRLNCKQAQQMTLIWNGFHAIVLMIMEMDMYAWMVHLLLVQLN